MKTIILFPILNLLFLFSFQAQAESSRQSYHPTFTYDLGASSGTYDNYGYTEIEVGLNWRLLDHMIWRNSVFTRFGTNIDSAVGLDTSFRFVADTDFSDSFGLGVFAGPGYRFSDRATSGLFGEAGVMVKAAGFAIGLGYKAIVYNSPGTNPDGSDKPKTDSTIFVILAAGGVF